MTVEQLYAHYAWAAAFVLVALFVCTTVTLYNLKVNPRRRGTTHGGPR